MIKDELQKLMHQALKNHEKERLGVLRYLLSQIQYKEINSGKPVSDEDVVLLLRGEIKKRNESIELFQKGGRQDLVKQNQNEKGG